ncbi:MAG: hypothetical protein A2W23_02400 [Planctomycetes bacterium RBG_16_43_13]|nr:MAG: hypothetical protein A2W23_02400 [Planctomycetes bacterium RBG_16_43_13]
MKKLFFTLFEQFISYNLPLSIQNDQMKLWESYQPTLFLREEFSSTLNKGVNGIGQHWRLPLTKLIIFFF